jgi:hypothetical protein
MKPIKANDDLISVKQFIVESKRNLDIATAIYEQYEGARETIIKDFLDRLETSLKAALKGWSYHYDSPFFTSSYGAFFLRKPCWNDRYAIVLEAYNRGERMIYGVWRDENLLKSVPRSPGLLGAVRKKIPDATSRKYYEAEIRMTSPAKDWRKPEILWRMHSDDSFCAEVAALLVEVVSLAEKHIDVLAKNCAKRRTSKM